MAIGGGTIRDVMLGTSPFWTTNPFYLLCTAFALLFVIVCRKHLERLKNAWFVFDTLGLALFTIAGIQKSIAFGQPYWVAIIMGCITGAAGGVIRDILLNNEPVIFQKEIYATACVLGGVSYWAIVTLGFPIEIATMCSFLITCVIRLVAVRYHIALPKLKD